MTEPLVAGVDGCRRGWIAVVVGARDGAFRRAALYPSFDELLRDAASVRIVAVDVPIGLPRGRGPRRADVAARRRLGPRGATLFVVPPRAVLAAPTYAAARRTAARLGIAGVTAQAYNLRGKIFDVERAARRDRRVYEIHPEISFAALAGRPLTEPKKTWNGLLERIELLRRAGIRLPERLDEAGRVGADDVVDAAAAAWSARRIARGEAERLPAGPVRRAPAIWY